MLWDDLDALEEPIDRDWPQQRVLVVVVPSPRDWERVCSEHWYRLPLAHAPRRVGAEYLAFYHPGCFEALRWTISYYAPIERYTMVSRRELLPAESDHPRADALYYRIDVGSMETLPHPIPSRRLRRVTFIATTMSRLLQAVEINDLWPRETTRSRMERVLREQTPGYGGRPPHTRLGGPLPLAWGRRKTPVKPVPGPTRFPHPIAP